MDNERSDDNGVESECVESKANGRQNAPGGDDSMEDMDDHD